MKPDKIIISLPVLQMKQVYHDAIKHFHKSIPILVFALTSKQASIWWQNRFFKNYAARLQIIPMELKCTPNNKPVYATRYHRCY